MKCLNSSKRYKKEMNYSPILLKKEKMIFCVNLMNYWKLMQFKKNALCR